MSKPISKNGSLKSTIERQYDMIEMDHVTGEVTGERHEQSVRYIHGSEPAFVKLYVQDLMYLKDMPRGLTAVVYALLRRASYIDDVDIPSKERDDKNRTSSGKDSSDNDKKENDKKNNKESGKEGDKQEVGGLRVLLPKGVKDEIVQEIGTTMPALNNALTKLCKGDILRRVSTGVYVLNPFLFGRGEWRAINAVRMTWDYDAIHGRTFATSISYHEDSEPEEEHQ